MQTKKNAVVELMHWKNERAEKLCTVDMSLKEDVACLTIYSTHSNQS